MQYDGILKDWIISNQIPGRYGKLVAVGKVYEDSKGRFPDGKEISTSPIVEFDVEAMVIYTTYSVYKLD